MPTPAGARSPSSPPTAAAGFPWVVGIAMQEMLNSANMALAMAPLLTQGAIDAIAFHGSEEQREVYMKKMVSGEWTGSMNLTEPDAGSDVGALRTKAVRQDDGSYRISGQKIYITFGEHDFTENIIHLVLARTPDAPVGTKGISCFIVPKYLVEEDGSLGERNDVKVVSLEHKMGIRASPTCTLAYGDDGDGAVGYLIGEENAGMRYMFTMMNNARLGVGVEGLGLAVRSYQQAVAFAQERRQGYAPGAARGEKSLIIDHPDVRRMLLTMRSTVEAMRALCYTVAEHIDLAKHAADEADRTEAEEMVDLLIPLAKSWCTDEAERVTSIGIQIHGGMGYIEETGAAQHYRDAKITQIYEGTNGIQAMDLVGRKMPMRAGGVFTDQIARMRATVAELAEAGDDLAVVHDQLAAAVDAGRVHRAVADGAGHGRPGGRPVGRQPLPAAPGPHRGRLADGAPGPARQPPHRGRRGRRRVPGPEAAHRPVLRHQRAPRGPRPGGSGPLRQGRPGGRHLLVPARHASGRSAPGPVAARLRGRRQAPASAVRGASQVRVAGKPLVPSARALTASTWCTEIRAASKATAEPAMYSRQVRARPGPASCWASSHRSCRLATQARRVRA